MSDHIDHLHTDHEKEDKVNVPRKTHKTEKLHYMSDFIINIRTRK